MTTEVAFNALCILLHSHVTLCSLRKSIRSTTQIWVATDHQYGISVAIPEMSFLYETSGGVAKCLLFFQARHCIVFANAESDMNAQIM